jgi:transcriptional regulator with XRE-family HTH domain
MDKQKVRQRVEQLHRPSDDEITKRASEMIQRGVARYGNLRDLSKQTGVSPANLSRIARCKVVPRLLVVHRIALALGETFYLGVSFDAKEEIDTFELRGRS